MTSGSATDLINELEKIALGELRLTPQQFGGLTIAELEALEDGYLRRYNRLEDLFIIYCALPIYNVFYKKAPTYRELTAYRSKQRRGPLPPIDPELVKKWKPIL